MFCRISALAPSFCRISEFGSGIIPRVCNSHCRGATKVMCDFFSGGILIHNSQFIIDNARKWKFSGGNSCVPSVSHNLFFSGGNYKFPIFSQPNSCVPLVASDHRSSAEIRQNCFFRSWFPKILHSKTRTHPECIPKKSPPQKSIMNFEL